METEDRSLLPLYEQQYLCTVKLPLVCPQCGMRGMVSQTYMRYVPISMAIIFGLVENKVEVISGLPSWQGKHSGCSYVWQPQQADL